MAEEHEANQEHLNEDTMQVQKEEQKQEQKQERAQDQMQESIPKSIPESIQEPISEPIQKPPTSRRKPVRLWSLISLALGAGLLFAGYWYVLNSWYHQSYQPQELYREAESLVETHNSALRMEKGYPSTDARINPLLTQTITLKLYTNVGDREVIAGEVTVSKPLIGKVQVEYDLNQRYLDDDYTYSFPLPPSLFGTFYEMRDPGAQEAVWQQVAHIDDGHVAQMAFSTWLPMSPEQLLTNLQKYDLHVLDMPVFGGELKSFMSGFEMATTNRDTHYVSHLSLRPPVKYGRGGMSWHTYLREPSDITLAEESLLQDVQWLIDQGDYHGREADKKRLEYINNFRLEVYGAVVTGPVRELEKLKAEKDFYHYELGPVEVWNWQTEE